MTRAMVEFRPDSDFLLGHDGVRRSVGADTETEVNHITAGSELMSGNQS